MQDIWLEYWVCPYVIMSLLCHHMCGYFGDYSPPFGGGVRGRGQLVGQALLLILSFLYRVPTIIL